MENKKLNITVLNSWAIQNILVRWIKVATQRTERTATFASDLASYQTAGEISQKAQLLKVAIEEISKHGVSLKQNKSRRPNLQILRYPANCQMFLSCAILKFQRQRFDQMKAKFVTVIFFLKLQFIFSHKPYLDRLECALAPDLSQLGDDVIRAHKFVQT